MNDIKTKLPPPTIGHQPYLIEESYANDKLYDGVIAVKRVEFEQLGYYARHIPSHLQTQGQELIEVEVPAYQTSVLDVPSKSTTKLDSNNSSYATPQSSFNVLDCWDCYSTPPPVFAQMKKPKQYRSVSHDDDNNENLQSKNLEDELAQMRARVIELEGTLSRHQHKDKLGNGKISSMYPRRIVTAASSPVGMPSQLAQIPKQIELPWLAPKASTSSIMFPCKMMPLENVKDNGKKRRLRY